MVDFLMRTADVFPPKKRIVKHRKLNARLEKGKIVVERMEQLKVIYDISNKV
jgi:hypothetical protein